MPNKPPMDAADEPPAKDIWPDGLVIKLGLGQATALDGLCETIARALGAAAENAVAGQQHTVELAQAATARSVELLYSLNPGAPAATPGAPPTSNPKGN